MMNWIMDSMQELLELVKIILTIKFYLIQSSTVTSNGYIHIRNELAKMSTNLGMFMGTWAMQNHDF